MVGHECLASRERVCDSRGAVQNALHPSFSDRLRHVDNKIFYIREIVESLLVKVIWIPGERNPADLGTKSLRPLLHRLFGSFLQGEDLPGDTTTTRYARLVARLSRSTNGDG